MLTPDDNSKQGKSSPELFPSRQEVIDEDCTKLPAESMANRINVSMARKCLSLIAQDKSGVYFVDFLGNGFNELQRLENWDKIIENAHKFINSQVQNFGPDDKIGVKYLKLKMYFESSL
jgi:hypothetical protein